MANRKQEVAVVPPEEEPEEMPLPSDPKVIFLGDLFALALLTALYVAAEIVLPLGRMMVIYISASSLFDGRLRLAPFL